MGKTSIIPHGKRSVPANRPRTGKQAGKPQVGRRLRRLVSKEQANRSAVAAATFDRRKKVDVMTGRFHDRYPAEILRFLDWVRSTVSPPSRCGLERADGGKTGGERFKANFKRIISCLSSFLERAILRISCSYYGTVRSRGGGGEDAIPDLAHLTICPYDQ